MPVYIVDRTATLSSGKWWVIGLVVVAVISVIAYKVYERKQK
jgi:hypothetical protein